MLEPSSRIDIEIIDGLEIWSDQEIKLGDVLTVER